VVVPEKKSFIFNEIVMVPVVVVPEKKSFMFNFFFTLSVISLRLKLGVERSKLDVTQQCSLRVSTHRH
jgi:hypothetical protein